MAVADFGLSAEGVALLYTGRHNEPQKDVFHKVFKYLEKR
jgi:hypothetical protein